MATLPPVSTQGTQEAGDAPFETQAAKPLCPELGMPVPLWQNKSTSAPREHTYHTHRQARYP